MDPIIIDGKKLSEEILDNLKYFFKENKAAIAAISVGDKEKGEIFIRQKQKVANNLNIDFFHFHFDENISNNNLRKKINEICKNKDLKGIIIQLPLPQKFNTQSLLNVIPIKKDVDVLNERHFAQFIFQRSKILPPAVSSIKYILEKYNISFQNKTFGIVGCGRLVGLPILLWLVQQKITTFIVDIHTLNPEEIIKKCDIVISGVGKPHLIDNRWIKKGAIVIDFGFEVVDGKMSGDINFETIKDEVGLITKTPNGTGLILVAMLFQNLKELML